MKPRIFFLILLAAFLAGCSASGPKFEGLGILNASSAEVYVYRPSKFTAAASAYTLYLDNDAKYELRNGGFIKLTLPLRAYKFKLGEIEWNVYLAPNERHFYRFDIAVQGFSAVLQPEFGSRVVKVTEEGAIKEMRELKSSM